MILALDIFVAGGDWRKERNEMAEYIEREALLKDIDETVIFSVRSGQKMLPEIIGANKVIDRIKRQPIVDVDRVNHG